MVDGTPSWRKLLSAAGNVFKWNSADQRKDAYARLALAKANPTFVDADRVLGNEHDFTTTIGRAATGLVSGLGLGWKALQSSMAMAPLLNGLPMLQALVLMGLYMFLPLVTFLSGFDLKVMFLGAIGIFTVKFWAVMWFVANWIDARLIKALYPGLEGNVLVNEMTQVLKGTTDSLDKRALLNILLMLMFIALPMIWTAMMAWVGIHIGHGITNLTQGVGKTADGAASAGTAIATKVARGGR